MEAITKFFAFVVERKDQILELLIQHIQHSKKSIFIRVADGHIQYKIFHLNASQKF